MFAGILQVEVLFHPFSFFFLAGILHVHELSLPPQPCLSLSMCVFLPVCFSLYAILFAAMVSGLEFRERERKKEKGGSERTDGRERARERDRERTRERQEIERARKRKLEERESARARERERERK
jgi:hypothetical protein